MDCSKVKASCQSLEAAWAADAWEITPRILEVSENRASKKMGVETKKIGFSHSEVYIRSFFFAMPRKGWK
jgi:hypothetical protein